MGVISQFIEHRATFRNPTEWMRSVFGGGRESATGLSITEDSALTFAPFWSAVRVISSAVSSLPLLTYRRVDDGRERATNHPLYELLHGEPNTGMDSLTFWETRIAHALVYGNGYAEIQRDGGGRVIALWPLLPTKTRRMSTEQGLLYYEITLPDNSTAPLSDANVLHIKGLGFDGYTGYNVVAYHREAIGLGMATKEFGARLFGNAGTPKGVIEHPKTLKPEAVKKLRESFGAVHSGLSNANRVAILEEGMTWNPMGINPEDAQSLETQKFSVDDVARIFNVPPHMIASMDRATFSNIEAQGLDFLTRTLLYWLKKVELETTRKLFTPAERKTYYVEFLIDAFMRGDTAARNASYSTGRQWGYLSVNDIRRKENMNTIGAKGDIYLEPENMRPAGSKPTEPAVIPPGSPDEDNGDVLASQRQVLLDICGRIVRKEISALRTAAKKGADFEERAGRFFAGHAEYIGESLSSALGAAWVATHGSSSYGLPAYIAEFAEDCIEESRQALTKRRLEPLLLDWEAHRAERMTDRLLTDLQVARR